MARQFLAVIVAGAALAAANAVFAQAPNTSPPPAPPTPAQQAVRAAGDSAIAHRDWKSLVAVYAPVTKAEPNNGMAWFRLGAGLEELGKLPEAANALEQAVRVQFQSAQAELRLARISARRKMADSALAHLDRAASLGVPVEMMTGERDLESVRADARYVAIVSKLEATRYPCRSMPETHQFDFWIGEWVVTPWTGPAVSIGPRAMNRISPELEHCVIKERWTAATGSVGESMNFWDPNRRAWRQVWMDPGQGSLDYEGEYKDGAMRFHGWTLGTKGEHVLQKLTFFNVSPDTVRQLFEQSLDSGKTWSPTFDGRYVRVKPGAR